MTAKIRVNSVAEAQAYFQLTLEGQAEPITTGQSGEKQKRDNPEQRLQIAVFAKRKVLLLRYPQVRWLYANLSGIFITPALLQQISEAGLVKGVLDLRMDVEHVEEDGTRWSGLAIDLKTEDGRPTPEQLEWAAQLWKIGIRAYFCGGSKPHALTPLEDALYTLYAYAKIAGEPPYVTAQEQQELADMKAQENLARKQRKVEKEARALARALAPPPAPKTSRKSVKAVKKV